MTCGIATLKKRGKGDSKFDSIELGVVTGLSVSQKVSLIEAPVFTLPSKNRYIVDTGNTEQIHISLIRRMPDTIDDQSSESRDWSNAKWYKMFMEFIDFWQNTTYNNDPQMVKDDPSTDLLTGGFLLDISGDSGSELMIPVKDEQVFIRGEVEIEVQMGGIRYDINFVKGTMSTPYKNQVRRSIRLRFKEGNEFSDRIVNEGCVFEVPYCTGHSTVWVSTDAKVSLYAGKMSSWDDLRLPDGFDTSKTIVFTPKPMALLKAEMFTAPLQDGNAYDVEVPENADYMECILVGGGGGGGISFCVSTNMYKGVTARPRDVSGGGGSGQVLKVPPVFFESGTVSVSLKVGKGGRGGQYLGLSKPEYHEGEDGEPTVLTVFRKTAENPHKILEYSAEQGYGGKGGWNGKGSYEGGAAGMRGAGSGGDGSGDAIRYKPENGHTGNNSKGVPGKGSPFGAGGGAADISVKVGDVTATSRGGSAMIGEQYFETILFAHIEKYKFDKYDTNRGDTDGAYGGGGASISMSGDCVYKGENYGIPGSTQPRSGDGGDGFAVIRWYQS